MQITEAEAKFLCFLKKAPIVLPQTGILAGFAKADPAFAQELNLDFSLEGPDNLHFPMGTSFLKYGFRGVSRKALQNRSEEKTEEQNQTLRAISVVYDAIADYLKKHVEKLDLELESQPAERQAAWKITRENLIAIAENRPETLAQAIQAYYIAWRLRCIISTATVGRLDQYLFPFYEKETAAGTYQESEAFSCICELWEKMNECGSGDTLANVMLGGCTQEHRDQTNALSILMLKATRKIKKPEPHINARIHSGTEERFLTELLELQLCGFGQGSVYNDEVVIPAMCKAGIPSEYAYQYGNDGCTEILIDQKSMIFFSHLDCVKCLELALFDGRPPVLPGEANTQYWTHHMSKQNWKTVLEEGYQSGDVKKMECFEEVYAGFLKQYTYQINRALAQLKETHDRNKRKMVAPPFLNGSFEEILESGIDLFRGGLPVDCTMLFSGSVPTAADGLAALKKVVFEDRKYTMQEVLTALEHNFEGYEEIRRALKSAPKFGNDDDSVDLIAARIANDFCDVLQEFREKNGMLVWPALLGFMFVQEAYFTGATPDGRKWRDPIAEHYSATPGAAKLGPTAVLASSAKGPMNRAYGTAPVHITLSRSWMPMNHSSTEILKDLVLGAIRQGIVMLNIAIYDVNEMRKAQKNPEAYEDLIVRVWGYNAKFTDLSRDMQEHVISRVLH